ncbi:hypothetical protein ACHAXS_011833 [Conticribra weissflogii]
MHQLRVIITGRTIQGIVQSLFQKRQQLQGILEGSYETIRCQARRRTRVVEVSTFKDDSSSGPKGFRPFSRGTRSRNSRKTTGGSSPRAGPERTDDANNLPGGNRTTPRGGERHSAAAKTPSPRLRRSRNTHRRRRGRGRGRGRGHSSHLRLTSPNRRRIHPQIRHPRRPRLR